MEVLYDEDGKPTDREVETAIFAKTKKGESFRLIIQRGRKPLWSFFGPNGYCYYVIATNWDELSAEAVIRFHNQRGQVENHNRELKIGFGMEQAPSDEFRANALWFALEVIVYNLAQAQKLLFLDPE